MTSASTRRLAVWALALSIAGRGAELHAAGRLPALPSVPLYQEFGAWIVACDNMRRCVVKSLDDAGADAGNATSGTAVLVTRDAGSHATPHLLIDSNHAAGPSALTLDGQPTKISTPWSGRREGGALLNGKAALSLLRRMQGAGTLAFSLLDGQVRLSLRGLAAALRVADAVQGRTGSVTALFAPGPASSASVPPAPGMPTVRAAPPPPALRGGTRLVAAARRALASTLKARGCHPDTEEPSWAKPLDARRALVAIGCEMGAYQGWALLAAVPRAAPFRARVLHLPLLPGEPRGRGEEDGGMLRQSEWDPPRGVLMTPDYDPVTATLGAQVLGRGLADCGMAARWVFDGKVFQPASFTMQQNCGSLNGDWPVLFRTRSIYS